MNRSALVRVLPFARVDTNHHRFRDLGRGPLALVAVAILALMITPGTAFASASVGLDDAAVPPQGMFGVTSSYLTNSSGTGLLNGAPHAIALINAPWNVALTGQTSVDGSPVPAGTPTGEATVRQNMETWLADAAADHILVAVAFKGADNYRCGNGATCLPKDVCGDSTAGHQVAPSQEQFKVAVRAFLNAYGPGTSSNVRVLLPWGEPNFPGNYNGEGKDCGDLTYSSTNATEPVYTHDATASSGVAHRLDVGIDWMNGRCPTDLETGGNNTENCGARAAAYWWVLAHEKMVSIPACGGPETANVFLSSGCVVMAGGFSGGNGLYTYSGGVRQKPGSVVSSYEHYLYRDFGHQYRPEVWTADVFTDLNSYEEGAVAPTATPKATNAFLNGHLGGIAVNPEGEFRVAETGALSQVWPTQLGAYWQRDCGSIETREEAEHQEGLCANSFNVAFDVWNCSISEWSPGCYVFGDTANGDHNPHTGYAIHGQSETVCYMINNLIGLDPARVNRVFYYNWQNNTMGAQDRSLISPESTYDSPFNTPRLAWTKISEYNKGASPC